MENSKFDSIEEIISRDTEEGSNGINPMDDEGYIENNDPDDLF